MFETLKRRVGAVRRIPDSLARIEALDDWTVLAARLGHHTVARTETVKFVIDLQDDGRAYFLNSTKWLTHYAFVVRFVNPRADYKRFLTAEYGRDDRRFVLGSVMHYLDGDHWTIELDRSDTMAPDLIAWMFEHIAQRVAITSDLRFRPVSPGQTTKADSLSGRVPVLDREAINATLEYQPVVLGVAYGYLRLLRGTIDVSSLRPYDIVVTDHVPIEIPPVAALVTSELQAPLAHVAVLSRNRNTPDMAVRDAVDLDAFRAHDGELVKLVVGGQDYAIERTDLTQAEAAWASMRPKVAIRPELDLSVTGLVDVRTLPANAASYVGAKASQMAELGRIEAIATPGGFVLPFSAYADHLESAGVAGDIRTMLGDPEFRNDAAARAHRLAQVREAIVAHPVDAALLSELRRRLRALSVTGPYIFRSSTNAEDLPGFNGAGLYESIPVPGDLTDAQMARALRQVWASVWLQRAYEEREWYRIDHEAVAMGVLFQAMVDDAVASGVAITENPFKEGLRAVFINTQVSGATVTSAMTNELPEQYLVATWTGQHAPELLSNSSLTGGAPILTEEDLLALTDQLLRIHDVMLPQHAPSANAMDVEFALTAQRRFVMLQARPHTVVYNLDRARPPPHGASWVDRILRRIRRVVHRFAARQPRRVVLRN